MIKLPRVRTKRLEIRPYRLNDYESWRDGYRGRLPKRNKFDDGPVAEVRISRQAFIKTLAFHARARNQDRLYVFGVFDRLTKAHIGFLDIYIVTRLDFQIGNLGYAIHNQYWGYGFATEAARAVALLAFKQLKLHRLEVAVDTRNRASVGVAKGLGAQFEGPRRGVVFEDGKWCDLTYYSVRPRDLNLREHPPTVLRSFRDLLRS